ncbi:hypothetical protein [Mycobacteroides abscessus]|uniref:hypothetical protein n=1 Tax=Mycobacteroides abscessus TaxID=36809 RepID=UPI0010572DDB|nr:hypothetical protein [Mycobacteroides abscessus]
MTSTTPMHPALQKIQDDADRRWSEAHPGQDVRVHRALEEQAKSHPAPSKSGLPWWAWILIVPAGLVGLGWLVIKFLDADVERAHARVAELKARYDDDDDDWDDDDDEPLLTYPSITPVAAEPIPYPEPTPSTPAAPAPSGGSSLMDRLGK